MAVTPLLGRQRLTDPGTCCVSSLAKSEIARCCDRLGLKKKKKIMVDGVHPESQWIPGSIVFLWKPVLYPSDHSQPLGARPLHYFITLLMHYH